MRTTPMFVAIVFSLVFASTSDAAGGRGIPIRFGWGSEIKTVGSVDPDSEVGREMADNRVSVALAWDWFWLALPVWCSDRKYVLHDSVETLAEDTVFWELKDQSKESVASITGISESDLTFPFYAYIPPGWIALGAILLIGNFLSGPSPKKRFAKLALDRDYVHALGLMVQSDESSDNEEYVRDQESVKLETEAQLQFEKAVSHLVSQGISESKAQRNLQFLVGYLHAHPTTTIPTVMSARQPQ